MKCHVTNHFEPSIRQDARVALNTNTRVTEVGEKIGAKEHKHGRNLCGLWST